MEFGSECCHSDSSSLKNVSFERTEPLCSNDDVCFFEKYKIPNGLISSAFRLYEQAKDDQSSQGSEQEGNQKENRVRGTYRKYTILEKKTAVERIQNGEDIKKISEQYCIPRRNLLRWKKNGYERKEGGGRPTDQDMENVLYEKILNKNLEDQKQIRDEAIKLSKSKTFKASKGWFLKFCKRYELKYGKQEQTALRD